jgi:hypothetical protein
MCVCVCVCMYMYVCLYMYIYVYIYMYIFVYIYAELRSSSYICRFILGESLLRIPQELRSFQFDCFIGTKVQNTDAQSLLPIP